MRFLKAATFLIAMTTFCTANAGVRGILTASPEDVKMTVRLDDKSQLMVKLEVNGRIENCPISLSNASMGYTTPQNMGYEEMKGANFFAFSQGAECWDKAEAANSYLPSLKADVNFFQQSNVPADKGVEILKTSGIKLSFCFQVSDPYTCSKPVGFEDLKGGPVEVYPFSSAKK